MPATRSVRIGLHARNDFTFAEGDYLVIKEAGIETFKILSFTGNQFFERVRQENPGLEFIVRLHDSRIGASHPTPESFVAAAIPRINELRPFAAKFEILNEPNHHQGYEGWGSADDAARSFRDWYLEVLGRLKKACPWALFGFPGLAPHWPHRDLEWLDICRDAIQASDWLGCHIYWQGDNQLKNDWGLRFKLYHEKFPDKVIEITEFGNSTPNLSGDIQAAQYAMFYQELFNYPYLGSACSFIVSSPDLQWVQFVWRKESGEFRPMVRVTGNIPRLPLVPPKTVAPAPEYKVDGPFLALYRSLGPVVCGLPITNAYIEAGVSTQYFQNLGMEERGPGQVVLKPVGKEAYESRLKIRALEARAKQLGEQITNLQRQLTQLNPEVKFVRPPIQDITDLLPKHQDKTYGTRTLQEIRSIVIHHTAAAPNVGPEAIARYQVTQRGWPAIGYHFVVMPDGTIYQTNRLETISYHARSANQTSAGIALTGNFMGVGPTNAQLEGAGKLLAYLLKRLGLPCESIKAHKDLVATACPGDQWENGVKWRNKLMAEIEQTTRNGGA